MQHKTKGGRLLRRALLSAGVLTPLLTVDAWAQPPAQPPAQPSSASSSSSGGEVIETIVVTARKRSENIQNVPVAITAMTGNQLKERSVNTVKDLSTLVPSLYLQTGFDDPQSIQLTLRGRKQNDVNLAVDPSVGIYTDGFYNPRSMGMAGSLLDVSRVEVLRGPQGTLYGRNTTGGALSIYTNDPTDEWSGSVDVTGGNYGTWNIVGILNMPVTDNIDVRFVAQRGGHGAYGHDLLGHDLLNADNQYYRAKLKVALNDSWTVLFSGHYETDGSGIYISKLVGLSPADPGAGLPEGGFTTLEAEAELGLTESQALDLLHNVIADGNRNFFNNWSTQRASSKVHRYDVSMVIDGKLPGGLEFKSLTGYQHNGNTGDISLNPVPFTILTSFQDREDNYVSQEFQLLGGESSSFQWVVGAYGNLEWGRDYVNFLFVPALGPITSINDTKIHNKSLAAFGQATWEFLPTWRLTVGARYSMDERQGDITSLGDGVCVVPAPGVESSDIAAQCPRRFKVTFHKPVWLASLDHQLTENTLLYAKVATGYRSGGIQEGGNTLAESFVPFRPELNTEYEVGFKSELFDHRLRTNFAAYYDKYSDLQVTTNVLTATGSIAQAVTNAASAHIWGLEAEVDAILAENLSVHLTAAHTVAKYVKFPDFDQVGNPIDRSYEPFPVPKWTFGISPRYEIQDGYGVFAAQLDYSWQSDVVLDPTGVLANPSAVTQKGYSMLNARLSQHIDRWDLDLALFGTNLTETHYYDQASFLEPLLGIDFAYAGAPRTFGVEIIKKFGE